MFKPNFRITPKITSALMQIEACRQAIDELPIDATVLRHLRAVAFVFVDHRAAKVGKIHTNNYQVLTQVFVVAEVAAVPGAFSARATPRANESAIPATPAFKKSRRCMPVALPFDRPTIRAVIRISSMYPATNESLRRRLQLACPNRSVQRIVCVADKPHAIRFVRCY